MIVDYSFDSTKSLWERFQDQKEEPWPFVNFEEYKAWEDKQEKLRKRAKESILNVRTLKTNETGK